MRRLTLASASAVTRVFPSSARECSTPRSRVTRKCSTPRSRALLASARPLARVLLASAGSSRASARRGKLIRTSLALHACKQAIARPPRFRCFALALRASALSVSLLCTRCSGIRVLFSEPPCFFSEPAPRYLLRVPCSLLSSSEPAPRSLLRAPCSLLSSSEPRTRGALASYSARTCGTLMRASARTRALSKNTRV